MSFLNPNISKNDMTRSHTSVESLRRMIEGGDRSLIFFVGAGASMAGNTGMPSTPNLISQLLINAISHSGAIDEEIESYKNGLNEIGTKLGFEITLNDYWQICQDAVSDIYSDFANLEKQCVPNRIHKFLAYWLASKGTVVTTNYDCLIEREWRTHSSYISSSCVFQESGTNSYSNWWKIPVNRGRLYKIHGSLDDPSSCLGALEHVGTRLSGVRADILREIVLEHPLCFVGWRGVDPDIPPLLSDLLEEREKSLPIFWIHYEGWPAGTKTIDMSLDEMHALVRPLANQNPILTEADRAFGEMLEWIGKKYPPNPAKKTLSFDFKESVHHCTKTGLARMVGISLRRAGKTAEADQVLNIALSLADTQSEKAAALQEISLLKQQVAGRKTKHSKTFLAEARKAIEDAPDIRMQLNVDFGLLSQTIVSLKNSPREILKVPKLFRNYYSDIETYRGMDHDLSTLALHESLYQLYQGRLRFKLFGDAGKFLPGIVNWILAPFEIARERIQESNDIHLHSTIDIFAYRLLALANFQICGDVNKEIDEIERLLQIFQDDAREGHWQRQKREIVTKCKQRRSRVGE